MDSPRQQRSAGIEIRQLTDVVQVEPRNIGFQGPLDSERDLLGGRRTLVTGSVQAASTSPGRVTSSDTHVSPKTVGAVVQNGFRRCAPVRRTRRSRVVPCVNCAPIYCVMNGRVMASNSFRLRLALAYSNWYDHVVPSVEWIRRSGRAALRRDRLRRRSSWSRCCGIIARRDSVAAGCVVEQDAALIVFGLDVGESGGHALASGS